ncbi:K(+)-transporting ATPase subunit F [Candidatus Binatus sp.]
MRESMNAENFLGLICAVALTVYLVYAMLHPEKL